jgi:hypothetical protein
MPRVAAILVTIIALGAVATQGLPQGGTQRSTASPARAAASAQNESLHYQWRLRGFMGRLASVVLPSNGEAELRSRPLGSGRTVTELEITSSQAAAGEHFLYGARTDNGGRTQEAWSSYKWRDREKSDRQRVDEEGVVDIASGILLIRQQRPEVLTLRIWSDGRVYPVVVRAAGEETLRVPAGEFRVQRYEVRGVRAPGSRYWSGGMDLWLAKDAAATPVQIQVTRGWANVLLELTG